IRMRERPPIRKRQLYAAAGWLSRPLAVLPARAVSPRRIAPMRQPPPHGAQRCVSPSIPYPPLLGQPALPGQHKQDCVPLAVSERPQLESGRGERAPSDEDAEGHHHVTAEPHALSRAGAPHHRRGPGYLSPGTALGLAPQRDRGALRGPTPRGTV